LIIQDGGVNDLDDTVDGRISDPGMLGASNPDTSSDNGGCIMNPDAGLDWGLIFILTGLGMYVLGACLRKRLWG